jgi:hypothetical protein
MAASLPDTIVVRIFTSTLLRLATITATITTAQTVTTITTAQTVTTITTAQTVTTITTVIGKTLLNRTLNIRSRCQKKSTTQMHSISIALRSSSPIVPRM